MEDIHDAKLVVQTAVSLQSDAEAQRSLRAKLSAIEMFHVWYQVSGWLGVMQASRKLKNDDIASPLKEPRVRVGHGSALFIDELWFAAIGSRSLQLPDRLSLLISQLWASPTTSSSSSAIDAASHAHEQHIRRLQVVFYFLNLLDDEHHTLESAFLLTFPLPSPFVHITQLFLALDVDKNFARNGAARRIHDLIELADPSVICMGLGVFFFFSSLL